MLVGYLMPEEQQMEEEEDEDEEMDEEYTPEMAQELIRRGLILSKHKLPEMLLSMLLASSPTSSIIAVRV